MSIAEQAKQQAVTLDDVKAASERIKALVQKTPIATSRLFNAASGAEAHFKCENLQRGGSFKIRGALNFLLCLKEADRHHGIVTFSSGNHAQAVAIAAAHAGVRATIVMPADAPKAKVESTKAYGPEIVFFERQREDREEIATRIANETGAVVIPPFDHPWIIAGQGTAALELMSQPGEGGAGMRGRVVMAPRMIHDPFFELAEFLGVKRQYRAGQNPPVFDSPGNLFGAAAGIGQVLPQLQQLRIRPR